MLCGFVLRLAHQNPFRVRRSERSCMLDGIKHDWDIRPQTFAMKLESSGGYLPVVWTCQFCSVTIKKRYERPNAVLKQ